jgi:hypothetical protein
VNRRRALLTVLALFGGALAALLIVAVGFWATWQQASALAYRHSFDKLDSPWLWFLRFVCTPFLTAGFKLGLKSPIAFAVEAVMDLVFWTLLSLVFVQRIGGRLAA